MALWVAVDHALRNAGFLKGNSLLMLLIDGGLAVKVFMIVSGFVITHLLITAQEGYRVYLTRRFLRLFPVYAICCAAGWAISGLTLEYASSVAWADAPDWLGYRTDALRQFQELQSRFTPHLLAHLTMLHGAIPYEWLELSDQTFLVPAWSISLEWQFYLVAPLVFSSLRSPIRLSALFATTLVACFLYRQGMLGMYGKDSIIVGSFGWFAIGILSRLATDAIRGFSLPALPATLVLASILYPIAADPLPLAIWGTFWIHLSWGRAAGVTGTAFRWIFENPMILYLGRISYSIYLAHVPILIVFDWIALKMFPDISRVGMLAVQVPALLGTIWLSAGLFRYLEMPSIKWGRRWAGAVRPSSAERGNCT